mgnify:CR=1 FL=1
MTQLALQKALETFDAFQPTPTSLITFQSEGRVIVLGDEDTIQQAKALKNNSELSYIFKIQDSETEVNIEGYLGNFAVNITYGGNNPETLESDIILDLNTDALISLDMLPAGYLHYLLEDHSLKSIESDLLELVGVFEKPKYFNYHSELCAHGVNGKSVCTRCIDACPAGAITSLIEQISVDSNLCQGGGICATTCPSGAIEYVYPSLTDNGNRIRKMLQTFRVQGGSQAIVVFHAEDTFSEISEHALLPVRVEELGSVGMDLWLSTLVYGADQVVLLKNEEVPDQVLEEIVKQVEILHSMLSGLGLDPDRVSICNALSEISALNFENTLQPAEYSMPRQKRDAIFQAIDHIYQQQEKTRELISLPAGAAFGDAIIDPERCTLCLSCVSACPGKALQDGSNRELPELSFIESRCIQCGTCTQTCPEQAISISPRLVLNREKRNQSRVLHQDKPFGCISCGKPFATHSVINKMTDALKQHYMFKTPRALDRLKMCEDCRVADIVQDPEAMSGNYDQQKSISS